MKKLLLTLGTISTALMPLSTAACFIEAGGSDVRDEFYPLLDVEGNTLIVKHAVIPTEESEINRFYESLTGTFAFEDYKSATEIEVTIDDDGTGTWYMPITIPVSDLVHDGTGNTDYNTLEDFLNETWEAVGFITAKARPSEVIFKAVLDAATPEGTE